MCTNRSAVKSLQSWEESTYPWVLSVLLLPLPLLAFSYLPVAFACMPYPPVYRCIIFYDTVKSLFFFFFFLYLYVLYVLLFFLLEGRGGVKIFFCMYLCIIICFILSSHPYADISNLQTLAHLVQVTLGFLWLFQRFLLSSWKANMKISSNT